MSSSKILVAVAASMLAPSASFANGGCDPAFIGRYHDCVRIVDSLRPDKAGQMRVFAFDGSEFTAGQSQWLHGQLRLIEKACADGDQDTATRLLDGVQEMLQAHQRKS
jgi:hypothetical protein